MTEVKHTPGPWEVAHYLEMLTVQHEGYLVAEVYAPCKLYLEEREANARLISAAPELLEALDLMMDALECTEAMCQGEKGSLPAGFIPKAWSKARSALKKARS